jgi:hypothetical protein
MFGIDRKKRKDVAIYFRQEDTPILNQLIRMVETEQALSVSEIVLDTLREKLGINDYSLLQNTILEKYADGKLQGPRLFKTFADILDWELQNGPVRDLLGKWNITERELAVMVYLHIYGLRKV